MRLSVIPVIALAAVLGGCAAPAAMQVASFAADGIAYATTGKGTTDHALSALAGGNCRMSNLLKGRDICAGTVPAGEVVAALASAPSADEIAALGEIAPAAGSALRVGFRESPGMNLAEVSGAAPGSTLAGTTDAAGTLHVFLVAPDGRTADRTLFTVPGYTRNPGTFTGVVLGSDFFAPDRFVR